MDGDSETARDTTNIDPFLSVPLRGEKKQSSLTRDELVKYADDPFWVRLRWATFILFWLVWLGLLVAAIVLIATTPRCSKDKDKDKRQRLLVNRVGPLVELGESTWQEATEKLMNLSDTHVFGVFLPYILTRDVDIFSTEHRTFDHLQNFTASAKELNIKVIVELRVDSVETTHDRFERSERGELPYSQHFVWADRTDEPSKVDEKGWSWAKSERRKAYYLKETGAAVLNMANKTVRQDLEQWLHRWVDAGAWGVRLLKTDKLFTYQALKHLQLTDEHLYNNTPRLAELLLGWRTALKKRSNATLMVSDEVLSRGQLAMAVDFPPGADLHVMEVSSNFTESLRLLDNITTISPSVKVAMALYGLNRDMDLMVRLMFPAAPIFTWKHMGSIFGDDNIVVMGPYGLNKDVDLMVGLMLPATPVFSWNHMDSILGDDNNSLERRKIYNKTLEIRQEMQEKPQHKFDVVVIDDVFAFSWWADGHGYVTAVRQQVEYVNFNLTVLQPALPEILEAVVFSKGYSVNFTKPFAKTASLEMIDQCAIIMKF